MKLSRCSDSIISNRAERDIKTAVRVYTERTTETAILDDISAAFIHRLAVDSTDAKKEPSRIPLPLSALGPGA